MRLKRAVDAVEEQILPNVAERKRRLKEQVHIRYVDGQIASERPRVHRPLVEINGDLFSVYVDRVALVTRKAPRPAFQIDRLGMCAVAASSDATMTVAFSFTKRRAPD